MPKLLALLFAALVLIGLTLALPRPASQAGPQALQDQPAGNREALRPLHAEAISVRLLMGQNDREPADWSGQATLDQGELLGVEPWRFRGPDRIVDNNSWEARSLVMSRPAFRNTAKAAGKTKAALARAGTVSVGPTGVTLSLKAPTSATLKLTTKQGTAEIKLADLSSTRPRNYLNDRVGAQLVPTHAPIAATSGQEDFPAATSDNAKGAWVAYIEHTSRGPESSTVLKAVPDSFKSYIPSGGGDQLKLLHFDGTNVVGTWPATDPGSDLWRPSVVTTKEARVVLVWPQRNDDNWDLYMRSFDPEKSTWTDTTRLTTDPGSDSDPALVRTPDGRVHVAWQAWRNGQADILLAPVDDPRNTLNLSASPDANEWSPSIAASADGTIYVAFDTYREDNYDVYLARVSGGKATLLPVAASSLFEARPSLALDQQGRPWIAYEQRIENWGKDFGIHDPQAGQPLYRESSTRVVCVEGENILDSGDPSSAAATEQDRRMNSYPRLTVDSAGRPHLLYRHRQENNWRDSPVRVVGAVWYEYLTSRVGDSWSPPRPIPRSDNLLDNRPALVPTAAGPVLAFYSTDSRMHDEGSGQRGAAAQQRTVNNDLFVAALTAPANSADPLTGPPAVAPQAVPSPHLAENQDIDRMRQYRVNAGGKTYHLLRGEFHRHTEISSDGGGDGSLEDMWRYGLDVAGLDWIGCGDHDNGNGREYTWWITQKTTDLYHNAPAFNPMFTYERSVQYPGGHRNVMFPYRGVRTLPRLQGETGGIQTDVNGRDLDVQMLYKYLNELGGICAVHTSSTDMGTDWRENDPRVEPFVEIYQGDRESYEYFGAPRVAHGPGDAAGGWRPLGMVWNALALQYKLGFQSSSDHISTHISYAVALAENPSRQAIFDAFKKRHCYAATDNIILDVRCGDHLMGDEFSLDGPVTLNVKVHGTAPIKKVDIIKDFHHVYSAEPGKAQVDFSWTDEEDVNRRPSWYYVRVIQEDDELAWGSPMWITRRP